MRTHEGGTPTQRRSVPYPRSVSEVSLRSALPRHLTWLMGGALVWLTWQDSQLSRLGRDSHAYWQAWQGGSSLYSSAPGTVDAYNYSPAFAQLLWPLAQLPWPVFGILFSVAATVGLAHLLRPLGWAWVFPLLLCCAPEIMSGNIFWVLGLVAAYGLRETGGWAALWAFALLTKVTPGLGPLWFAVRREWRPLAVSVVATLAVVLVSWLLMPTAWHDWYTFLTTNGGGSKVTTGSPLAPPLVYRLPVALALLVWAAHTNRRWGVPVAMVLATPVTGIAAFTMLAAIPRLLDREVTSPQAT